MTTMQQARFILDAKLLELGRTFADADLYSIDLCEDGATVMVMLECDGQTLTTSWDWPSGERFDWREVKEQFLSNEMTVH
jgi:hypothetical protein